MIDLVTGSTGFLGGRLTRLLSSRGSRVRVLVRKSVLPSTLDGLNLEVVHGDLNDKQAIKEAVKGATRIFHCAGCSTDWAPWKVYFQTNVAGVENLVRAAEREPSVQRFVHVSTSDVYGYPKSSCEESGAIVDIGLPYNQSKILGEALVWEAGQRGLPITIVRPASIYGPGSKDFVLEIAKALRDGFMMYVAGGRSFGGLVYVDDVVEAMIGASSAKASLGQAYNIAPEKDSTWKEYIEKMAAVLKTRKPWLNLSFGAALSLGAIFESANALLRITSRPLLTRHAVYLFSRNQNFPVSKAIRDFGYSQKTDLSEGIRHSVEWLNSRK